MPHPEEPATVPSLDEADKRVVELISAGVDDSDLLLAEIGSNPGEALARLGSLELRGVIAQSGPGRYAVTSRGR